MENYIREAGGLLGAAVAQHPYRFAALPICCFCFFFFPFLDSFGQLFREPSGIGSSKLFIPRNSASERDKRRIEQIFPHGIYFHDRTFLTPNLRIINFEATTGDSIDTPRFVEFYRNLRTQLELLNVTHNGEVISYADLCSKTPEDGTHCFPDVFLLSHSYLALSQPVQYPVWQFSIYNSSHTIFTGSIYGGVRTDATAVAPGRFGTILSARCVRMIFNFPPPYHISKFDDAWDHYLHRKVKYPEKVRVTQWSRNQYERDTKLIAERTRRLLPLLALSLISFCCLSSMKCRCNNLRIALLSFYGVISAACGVMTAFGFLHIIGVRLVQIALITPFLVLSIGIDDVFIMLSVWERTICCTSPNGTTGRYELVRVTFRESIVSILLTTIGNVLVFTLGSFSPFPIIQIFCIYSAVSLFVVFLFQLTLFGSLLATEGRYFPDNNRSNGTLISVRIQERTCSSLSSSRDTQSTVESECALHALSLVYATIFNNKYFVTLIFLSYLIYLIGASIILNKKVDVGLQLSSLLPDDTHTYKYLQMYEEYFTEYSASMEVVLPDHLDYFNRHIQSRILHAVTVLENTSYTMKASFWLPAFLNFLENENDFGLFAINSVSVVEKMAHFLQHPAYRLLPALCMICPSKINIQSWERCWICLPGKSRSYRVITITMTNSVKQAIFSGSDFWASRNKAMHLLRTKVRIVEKQFSIRLLIYHVTFDLAEQDDLIPYLALSNAALAGMASTFATLLLIPSVLNCFLMVWATFSINFGVFALLAICGCRLDIISTVVILLSIGYSVDFSSHVLAHFHHFKQNSQDPLGRTLSTVGWPIVQASLSTIIGVLCVSPVNGYIVKTFVGGVLSVCCIGLYHSIVVLPALLSIGTHRPQTCLSRQRKYVVESKC